MLVMRRKAGESFLIGDDIEIQILEVSHSRVRIGVSAPGNVPIVRKEVVLTREENLSAARNLPVEAIGRLMHQLRLSAVPLTARQVVDTAETPKICEKERKAPE